MEFIYVFVLIIFMGETHSVTTQEEHIRDTEHGILLRKLQSECSDSNKTESVTWNSVLAGVVADSVKSLIPHKDKEEIVDTSDKHTGFLTTFCSTTLFFYKKYIYDKIFTTYSSDEDNTEVWTGDPEIDTLDPGNDVELIEPLSEKMCEGCDNTDETTEAADCPEGALKRQDGRCVALLIMAVPNQCPEGFKRDRLGFCRRSF